MERLTNGVEQLDGRLDDPDALAGNLRDLRRINRWLGGVRVSARAIDALVAHRGGLTVLDIGTGGADIPLALLARGDRRGQRVAVVAIDSRPEIVALARQAADAAEAPPGRLEIRQADGLGLPFANDGFDIAHASLVLHHLEPKAAVQLLREMARVARLGVVVNDLQRSRLGWLGAWLIGHLLTGNRYTRTDAPLSVRRAYTAEEAAALLGAADLVPVATARSTIGQRYAIAAVAAPSGPVAGGTVAAEHPYDEAVRP
ncbi:MAG: methyltransferase domain-containing protein [Candidatus Limnocylindrales bacterium]|jgi:ubiquinone/menaquinone biosynthesis C-methylase UbiE